MDKNEVAFHATFQQTLANARRLITTTIAKRDLELREMLVFALHDQTPSEYPFVLRYAFCRRERDGEQMLKIAAAVHLLQQSSFVTDDIFDCGELRGGQRPVYLKYDVNRAIIAAELLQAIALRCVSEELARNRFRNRAIVFNYCGGGFQVRQPVFEVLGDFLAKTSHRFFFCLAYFPKRFGRKRQYQSDLPAHRVCLDGMYASPRLS